MICNPGDLLLIPFPYADLASAKKRPVLALTAPDRHGGFVALAVTSVEQVEQAVRLEPAQLSLGTLARTSWVRLDKIFTLSASNISKSIGRVETGIIQEVLAGHCATVGYAPGC